MPNTAIYNACNALFRQAKALVPYSPHSYRDNKEAFDPQDTSRLNRHPLTNDKTRLQHLAMLQSRPSTQETEAPHRFSHSIEGWHLKASSPSLPLLCAPIGFRSLTLEGSPVAAFQQLSTDVGVTRIKAIIESAPEESIPAALKEKIATLSTANSQYFTIMETEAQCIKGYLRSHKNSTYRLFGRAIYDSLTVDSLIQLLNQLVIRHSKAFAGTVLYQANVEEHPDLIVAEAKATVQYRIGNSLNLASVVATLLMQQQDLDAASFEIVKGRNRDRYTDLCKQNGKLEHAFVQVTDTNGKTIIIDPWSNTFGYDDELHYKAAFDQGIEVLFTGSLGARPETPEEQLRSPDVEEESIPFKHDNNGLDLIDQLRLDLNNENDSNLATLLLRDKKEFEQAISQLSPADAASLLMDLIDSGARGKHSSRMHDVLRLRPDLQQCLRKANIALPPPGPRAAQLPSRHAPAKTTLGNIRQETYKALQEAAFKALQPVMLGKNAAATVTSIRGAVFRGAAGGGGGGGKGATKEDSTLPAPE